MKGGAREQSKLSAISLWLIAGSAASGLCADMKHENPPLSRRKTANPKPRALDLKGGARERSKLSAISLWLIAGSAASGLCADAVVRVFLQHLSKKARNINGFRAFGKWHFSAKTVFQRLILGRFMFWSAYFLCPGGDVNGR